jgi:hypothetical protein
VTVSESLHRIEIRGIPVPLWHQARVWFAGLLREFTILNTQDSGAVPEELLDFVAEATDQFAQFGRSDALLDEALSAGLDEVDQELMLPAMAREASLELWSLIERAEKFCLSGQMLTLVPDEDVRNFVHWYLFEVTNQIAGFSPTRWPGTSGS